MTQPEHLTVLVSIIIGLGITDLAKSIRDLLHPDRPVHWHWLPLTWVLGAIFVVVGAWWGLFKILQAEVWTNPLFFLLILFATLNLYFLCAFVLPDLDGPPAGQNPDGVDLEAFYFSASHRRAFFGVAIAFFVSFFAIANVWEVTSGIKTPLDGVLNAVQNSLLWPAPYGVFVFTDRMWLHTLLTIAGVGQALHFLIDVAPLLTGG